MSLKIDVRVKENEDHISSVYFGGSRGEYLPRCARGAGTGVVPWTLSSRANQGEW